MTARAVRPRLYSREQVEEAAFTRRVKLPVDRDELEAVVVVAAGRGATDALARVEVAPRSVPTERRQKVVRRAIEGEVVVLVKQDGLVVVARQGARGVNLGGDQVRIVRAVAVDEQEVSHARNGLVGDATAAAVAGADQELPAAARFDALDQLVHARWLQDGVLVAGVALVVDLDQHVLEARFEQEVGGLVDGIQDRGLVGEAFILALVEVADDDRQAGRVGGGDHATHAVGIVGTHRSIAAKAEFSQGCSRE